MVPSTESAWLLSQNCNGTAVSGWGTYQTGDCANDVWGEPGYGVCHSAMWTSYSCDRSSTQCTSCSRTQSFVLNECLKDNNLYACSTKDPDYSVFGSSYATAKIYEHDDCSGSPTTIIAGTLNKCLSNPLSSGSFGSVYLTCSKNGVAQITTYLDANCQQSTGPTQFTTNRCVNSHIYPPFAVSCYGL